MKKVFVLDFGSQYTQLIARKIRELGVFSEILPFDTSVEHFRKERPGAIILSGGPQSVYEKDSPSITAEIFNLGVPVLGICYGLQIMSLSLGGEVVASTKREYGFAALRVLDRKGILSGIRDGGQVWMSHGDKASRIPPGFRVTGTTKNCKTAVIESPGNNLYGIQFHPEVIHTRQGKKILANFLFNLAGIEPNWDMESFIDTKTKEIRRQVGDRLIVCGLSGGVDTLVTSLLLHRAVKDNLYCIFVDNGLLRKGEYKRLMETFRKKFDLNVIGVEAEDRFLSRLEKISSPERKRKIIGEEFIRIFKEEAGKIGQIDFLAQGTIYPDMIESNPVKGPSSKIKSHHNVGGLPKDLPFELIEPLKELFKDEVRELAADLGLEKDFISQHPFPGPGLAVRVIGEVTRERLRILREADDILIQEIRKARLYDKLWQAFAVLLPVRSVGVMGDRRTYQRVCVLRLVQSVDGMTADWFPADNRLLSTIANRIVNEVDGINRIVYDITTKPPGTIEWE